MFTGIIKEIGKIIEVRNHNENKQIMIQATSVISNLNLGDSVAINGVCQTVVKLGPDWFEVEAIPETLRCTNFDELKSGDLVNLENSLRVGDSLDGHFVMGHVDTKAKVVHLVKNQKGVVLEIENLKEISKYIVHKGSITINGVSLTISKVTEKSFEVSLIPFTLNNTNLGDLREGHYVNLEIDAIARYVLGNSKI